MNLIGDAISAGEAEAYGLANRVVPDHELFDTALAWARKLAGQAPLAVEQVKLASDDPDLDEGIENEKAGFATRLSDRGREGGHRRVPRQADAEVAGEVSRRARLPAARSCRGSRARRADPRGRVGRRADRGGDLGAVRDPRLPHPRQGAVGEGRPDGGRPHRRLPPRHAGASGASTGRASPTSTTSSRTRAHEALAELEARGTARGGGHPEHRPPARARRARSGWSRSTARSRPRAAPAAAPAIRSRASASSSTRDGVATCACCMGKVKPDVVLFGELLPEAAMAEAQELCAGADLLLCVGSSLEVYPVAGAARAHPRRRRQGRDRHPGRRRRTTARRR